MKIFNLQRETLHIEDADGNTVMFNNAEEYLKYTGKVLPDICNVSYEPGRDLHVNFDGVNDEVMKLPNASYDEDIASVLLYTARKADPKYGLTGEELFNVMNEEDEKLARAAYKTDSQAPVLVILAEGTFTFNGGDDSASQISGAVSLAEALGETDVNIWDVDNVTHILSFDSAMYAAAMIAKAWRDRAYAKQAALVEIASRVYEG
jgi:hypothetical protein